MTERQAQRRQGRPAAVDVEALNGLIIDTAKALFIKEGYEGASVEKIASLAGIGKLTIYRRYASKEALFIAVLESMSTGMWETPQARAFVDAPLDALKARCRVILDMTATEEGLAIYRVLIDAGTRFPELVASTVSKMKEPVEGKNLELLNQAQKQGQIRADIDIRNLGRVVSSMVTGWTLLNGLLGEEGLRDSEQRSQYFETAWSVLMLGIRP
ncbi:TetR/AcrR family transcriptional regulator [Asticcacaulis endophyticus]|uniref:TetR family transcriptional regulator n=1 Tax=Asticcacaulis endophyticus TaxID=1395890 RepID=A0A918Q3R4_9CAUL|nr:TetR/AcrR family transcriptional regulator [Asticcacaulis endophyticus]GGZ32199.1 TetR family transcriptional regulator [Asticcacaulis endophyticus]